jgi:hypothetical protein
MSLGPGRGEGPGKADVPDAVRQLELLPISTSQIEGGPGNLSLPWEAREVASRST